MDIKLKRKILNNRKETLVHKVKNVWVERVRKIIDEGLYQNICEEFCLKDSQNLPHTKFIGNELNSFTRNAKTLTLLLTMISVVAEIFEGKKLLPAMSFFINGCFESINQLRE